MMLKTCASHFHLRCPFTAVRYLELLSSPRAVHSSVQPLLVLSVTAFWEWQEQCSSCLAFEESPSSPAGQAVPVLGGMCLARHSDFPGRLDNTCLVSTGSLSVSKPAFMSQVCNSAAPGVSLAGSRAVLLPLRSFSCCPFRKSAKKWLGGAQA